ncbi:IclR family transcriptional regulator [Nocardioides sp. LHG3406-4]|uniref:IclR family transcriptional regulator n=1 Tax=Nocardioides sp. LHG3406-4 TaxID=2804575 RepID=UPI003CE8050F
MTRALDILEIFLEENELSAMDVVRRLELPRTTVHELLGTLVARGYLNPSPHGNGRYRLGIRTFQLGSMYRERLDLAREGHYVAAEVSARCEETVHLAVIDGREVTYIAKVDSPHPVRMVSEVGRRVPAHCTAVGKALLAGLTDDQLDGLYQGIGSLPALTPNSITSFSQLRREIEGVRRAGVALEISESNQSVACVGAPVYDHTGTVIAAMSISVPLLRWSDDVQASTCELVKEGARNLSETMGFRSSLRTPSELHTTDTPDITDQAGIR